jgi:hypothetical protein
MASTLLNEMGYPADAIERRLGGLAIGAGVSSGRKGFARRVASLSRFSQRRMMQAWADYLDALAAGGEVVIPITTVANRD